MSKTKKIMFVALIVGNLVLTGLIVRACFAEPLDTATESAEVENAEELAASSSEEADTEAQTEADTGSGATNEDRSEKEAIANAASGKSTDLTDLLGDALNAANAVAPAGAGASIAFSGGTTPGNHTVSSDDATSSATPDGISSNAVSDDVSSSATSDDAPDSGLASLDEELSDNTAPEEPVAQEELAYGGKASPASKYETKANGTVGDFVWFLEGRNKKSRPAGVKKITNSAALAGGWKYVIVLDPENKRNEAAVEYGHAELSFMGWMADVNLHRHRLHIPGFDQPADLTKEPVTMINGKWKDGVLWAKGRGRNEIRLTDFYEQDGQQFATGTYMTFDAIEANIALVRP